ncbi:MAG: mechanosensitive ion channel family protein [Gammaproteobacteria bacterium]|nr:mechanosensitive ion channel family protein [Gammaproteobacteria bacterium]
MDWLTESLVTVVVVAGGAAAGIVTYLAASLIARLARHSAWGATMRPVWKRCAGGLRLVLPLIGVYLSLPFALEDTNLLRAQNILTVALIGLSAYLLIRALYGIEDLITARLDLGHEDNLDARRLQTQLRVMRAVLASFIAFTTVIVILLFIPGFRQIGAGLLASAGIAGLVIGFAAQRALGNLLAGFQIAFTQPIRLDDVVVVEGEWGRIEEISLTYVVVRIWDERRLILPISYFLEKPFTNWTRETSAILGTVFLYTDYRAPIDELRAELDRILEKSEHWDGRVKGLVVTDSKEHTLELRALVSAKDGGSAWDLRCEVREKLVRFLAQNYPETLPRIRAQLDGEHKAA